MCADEHVLVHGHGREELDVLERARDSPPDDTVRRRAQQALAVEGDLSGVRPVEPRDQVEERRLAGAVRSDQPGDLAGVDRERDVVDRHHPAETAADVFDREEGHRATLRRQAVSFRAQRLLIPWGRTSVVVGLSGDRRCGAPLLRSSR
jgi:hypothetical protein